MPDPPRTHIDMLQICCGVCGKRKNAHCLRKITDNILSKIKSIQGYEDYNLCDERYPKMICKQCYFPVHERYSNSTAINFKYKLPDEIPNFKAISLPSMPTRSELVGYREHHDCFICDQNKVGRPKICDKPKVCSKCSSKIGCGIPHPCNPVEYIVNAVQELDSNTQNKVIQSLTKIKSDQNNNIASEDVTIQAGPSRSSAKGFFIYRYYR